MAIRCENCIHNEVCYMQEEAYDINAQLDEFGCEDYKPTADVVEVVRCKDCKCFFTYTEDDIADGNKVEGTDGACYMRVVNSNDRQFCAVTNDDFCSYGTPKERR